MYVYIYMQICCMQQNSHTLPSFPVYIRQIPSFSIYIHILHKYVYIYIYIYVICCMQQNSHTLPSFPTYIHIIPSFSLYIHILHKHICIYICDTRYDMLHTHIHIQKKNYVIYVYIHMYMNLCNIRTHNKTAIQSPHSLYRRTRHVFWLVVKSPILLRDMCYFYVHLQSPHSLHRMKWQVKRALYTCKRVPFYFEIYVLFLCTSTARWNVLHSETYYIHIRNKRAMQSNHSLHRMK